MKKTYYMVYKTTNLVNGKIYVGFHSTKNINDDYIGSGKLIKRAIEKYGRENFKREIIEIFENKEDAENFEAKIVNKEFSLRDDTYNIAIGGNVRIMFDQNNPWYGKKHTKETIEKIQNSRTATIEQRGNTRTTPTHFWFSIDGIEIKSKEDAKKYFKVKCHNALVKKIFNLIESIDFVLDSSKEYFLNEYSAYIEKNEIAHKLQKEAASLRFYGVSKTEEHKEKIRAAHINKDHDWQNKINKNPEKIAKTAEKHRGMKRSEETKENLRIANIARKEYLNLVNGVSHGKITTPFGEFSNIDELPYDKQHIIFLCHFGMFKRTVSVSMYKKYKPLISNGQIGQKFDELGWNYTKNE